MENKNKEKKSYVIALTGAAGFLVRHTLKELSLLKEEGKLAIAKLVLVDIRTPDVPTDMASIPIEYRKADLTNQDELILAFQNCDLVIHSGAIIDWGNLEEDIIFDINLEGTNRVIKACQTCGVGKMIYTSTMDVLYSGEAIINANEDFPYPKTFNDAYAESKALAEQVVLKAHDKDFNCAVIRPCGMYGPADPYHITETIKAVESGIMKFRIGDGSAKFQHAYVGNTAYAHALLARELLNDNEKVMGQIYLITDDKAENFFEFLEPIIEGLGYAFPPKEKYISYKFMLFLATLAEASGNIIRIFKPITLPITRSSVKMLCEDMTFVTNKANEHFAYTPKYSKVDAVEATVKYFKNL